MTKWFVKRYLTFGNTEVSTVLSIHDSQEKAEAARDDLRDRYQSDQYVAEPYDPEKSAWPS